MDQQSVPRLFACISQYLKPSEAIEPHIADHIAWLGEQDAAGRLVASGRQCPPSGGVIVLAGRDKTEIRALLAGDPFAISGCAAYWIFEFELNPEPIRGRLMTHFLGEDFRGGA